MPLSNLNCPICGGDSRHHSRTGKEGKETCPYKGLEYASLRAGHDRLYFGQWRKMDAGPTEIMRAYRQIGKHLSEIGRVLDEFDLPAARRDHLKAVEAYRMGDPREDYHEALKFMDNALSYAHRAIDDLLHEKGLPPHHPMDFAGWYDTAEVPFREEW